MDDSSKKFLHDLSGSFAVIKGFLKFLDQSELTDTERKFHSAAMSSAEKIEKVIEKVRVSKILYRESVMNFILDEELK